MNIRHTVFHCYHSTIWKLWSLFFIQQSGRHASDHETSSLTSGPDPADSGDDYQPHSSSLEEEEEQEDEEEDEDPDKIKNGTVLVDEDSIMSLFKYCQVCGKKITETESYYVGAQLNVKWRCKGGHKDKWMSSPNVRGMPRVHLQAASAILFTGSTFIDLAGWKKSMKLHMFSRTTYYEIQKAYLHPVIEHLYSQQRSDLITKVSLEEGDGKSTQLLGDGRCDSPGFSAKFCHYTFMLADTKEIIQCELVQVM